jgi:hypothetical protein
MAGWEYMARRKVFISHSGRDTWVARQIAHYVDQCGAESFLDEADIQIGDDFEERIRDFLTTADELIVLFTPWALERHQRPRRLFRPVAA